MKKQKVTYYNEHGQIDRLTTFINNHDWCMPLMVLIMIILCGIIEGL